MTTKHDRARRGRRDRRTTRVAAMIAASGLAGAALVTSGGAALAKPSTPAADNPFGPNVTIFDPSWSTDQINAALAAAQGYG
jgi:hypothetical protein